jgi:hypothetical protein
VPGDFVAASFAMSCSSELVHSAITAATSLVVIAILKRTTYCDAGSAVCRRRNCSRMRRLTALRSTAVRAFFFPIMSPRRGRGSASTEPSSVRRYTQIKRPRWARVFNARTKSSGWSSRAARGKAAPVDASMVIDESGAAGATNANADNGANVGDDCRQLSRQNAATLGATGADHAATTFGSHAGAKAVGALTANNGGLKCTFHDCLARSLGICGDSGDDFDWPTQRRFRNRAAQYQDRGA